MKKTTDSFYPHFVLPQVSIISPTEDLFARIKKELRQYGEIIKLEVINEAENMADVNLSFVNDKDAVIALKSTIRVNLSENNENLNSTIQMQPTPSFKKYLIDLSSALKLQKAPKASTPKKEEISKPISPPPSKNEEKLSNKLSSHKKDNKSMEIEGPGEGKKKVLVIGTSKRNEVPLEIVRPTKLVKRFFSNVFRLLIYLLVVLWINLPPTKLVLRKNLLLLVDLEADPIQRKKIIKGKIKMEMGVII